MQVYIPAKKAKIVKTSKGFAKTKPQRAKTWNIPENRSKRGEITTFSASSALRMKKKLLLLPEIEGLYGITLTIKRDAWKGDTEQIRKFWMSFIVRLKRYVTWGKISPFVHCFWRIELQKNGTPHWHCIVYCPSELDAFAFRQCYHEQVKLTFGYDCINGVAVDIRKLNSIDGAYAYISSHATKHKRSQLGWKGRQWGQTFLTKKCKEDYKAKVETLLNSAIEIDGIDSIPDGTIEVAFSQLCNIDEKKYKAFERTLSRFIFSKMRTQKVWKPNENGVGGRWIWSRLNPRKTCTKKRYFFDINDCTLKSKIVKTSIKWFATRQAVSSVHFFKPETASKLMEVVI